MARETTGGKQLIKSDGVEKKRGYCGVSWMVGLRGGGRDTKGREEKRTPYRAQNDHAAKGYTILIYFFFPRSFRGMKWNERKEKERSEEEGH